MNNYYIAAGGSASSIRFVRVIVAVAALCAQEQNSVAHLLHGGLKIVEPAIDLGILLAIASSFTNRFLPSDLIVLGEVGLAGEVRGVSRIETRLKEAIHMGFKKCILPKRNLLGLSPSIAEKITLIEVDLVDQAIRSVLS